jgi:hypothetical protein
MNEERSLNEIRSHRHAVLPDAESYRVVALRFECDLDAHRSSLALRIRNEETGVICSLQFTNPVFNSAPFVDVRDATGLYIMTTTHLGWDRSQQIEVGDWDGGPPLFWAEAVEREEGDPHNEGQPAE